MEDARAVVALVVVAKAVEGVAVEVRVAAEAAATEWETSVSERRAAVPVA